MATLSNITFFNPTQFSNCALWLDAADANSVVLSGGTVTTWNDKSGNGRNATGVGNPLYSNNFINLNGTSQFFNVNLDFLAGVTHNAFIVLRNFNFTNIYGATTGGLNANSLHIGFSNGANYRMNYWGNDYGAPITSNYRTNQSNIINYVWVNNTSKATFTNGRLEGSSNQPGVIGTMAGGGTIGNVVGQGLLNANLNEIIFYTRTLSQTERQQIEGYLAWKWNIQAFLPTTHPYYTTPYIQNAPIAPLLNPFVAQMNYTFIPTTVGGCALWLDAADTSSVVLSGNNVTQWNDKSGNGRNATQATTNLQPTYLSNGVYIGTTNFLNTTYTAVPSSETIFYVFRYTGFTSNVEQELLAPSSNGGRQFYLFNNQLQTARAGQIGLLLAGNTTINTTLLAGSTNNSSSIFHYLNGSNVGSNLSITGYTGTSVTVIGNRQNANQGLNGFAYEIVIYNTILSEPQRQQIEGYLAWKWGLQASLPTTHPFYRNPYIANLPLQPILNSPAVISTNFYNPRQISNLALWLDAADINSLSLTGSTVTQWIDKSGSNNNGVPHATGPQYVQNAQNGLPGLYFAGSNTLRCGAFLTATSFSCFLVANKNAANTMALAVWKVQFGSFFSMVNGNNNRVDVGVNNTITYGISASINTAINNNTNLYGLTLSSSSTPSSPFTFNGSFNGSNTRITGTSTNGNATTCAQQVSVGGLMENGSPSFQMTGYIYEAIIYTNELTTNQRQQIEGYLAWKWGLQKSLPTNHPFYLFPPG